MMADVQMTFKKRRGKELIIVDVQPTGIVITVEREGSLSVMPPPFVMSMDFDQFRSLREAMTATAPFVDHIEGLTKS